MQARDRKQGSRARDNDLAAMYSTPTHVRAKRQGCSVCESSEVGCKSCKILGLSVVPALLDLFYVADLLALASYCTLAFSLTLTLCYILHLSFILVVAVDVVLPGMIVSSPF